MMLRRKVRLLALISALVAAFAVPQSARAEHGKLNLHAELGVGMPIVGPLAPPGKRDNLAHLSPAGWLSLDAPLAGIFAIEAIGGAGGLIDLAKPNPPEAPNKALWMVGVGGRLRFLEDHTGYKKQGGSAHNNLWTSLHLGYHQFDGGQFGIDAAVGYEFSISEPISVGVFLRGQVTFEGDDPNHTDAALFVGASLSTELLRKRKDSDGDGLTDIEEAELGTNPNKADTDGDGLDDPIELKGGTNPLVRDTDGDGFIDGEEDLNASGSSEAGETDPRVGMLIIEDTDEDGVPDIKDACPNTFGEEVDEQGCVVFDFEGAEEEAPQEQSLVLKGITFQPGSAEILLRSAPALERALQYLLDHPDASFEVAGHTDSRGAAKANLELSQARAEAVRSYLVEQGADPDRLTAKGYGETKPIADNKNQSGRAQNRRIEFRRID